jgi:hypothetical protein
VTLFRSCRRGCAGAAYRARLMVQPSQSPGCSSPPNSSAADDVESTPLVLSCSSTSTLRRTRPCSPRHRPSSSTSTKVGDPRGRPKGEYARYRRSHSLRIAKGYYLARPADVARLATARRVRVVGKRGTFPEIKASALATTGRATLLGAASRNDDGVPSIASDFLPARAWRQVFWSFRQAALLMRADTE